MNKFDLVITDMTMPGIVGSDLTKRILDIRPDIFSIFQSCPDLAD